MEKKKGLKIYICTDHDGHWPVGVASVITAKDKREAKKLLDKELIADGLTPFKENSYNLTEIENNKSEAYILNNGSY